MPANSPSATAAFDAVCCFAALYLIEEPMKALDEIVRVLAPGGRVALLASCNRGPLPPRALGAITSALAGVRVFGREELTAGWPIAAWSASSSASPALGSSSRLANRHRRELSTVSLCKLSRHGAGSVTASGPPGR